MFIATMTGQHLQPCNTCRRDKNCAMSTRFMRFLVDDALRALVRSFLAEPNDAADV